MRLRGDLLWLIRYVQDPKRAQPAIDGASEPDGEGWVTVTLHFENLDMAGYELMRFGGDLEVLHPVELRETMAVRAASMVARYASVPA